MIKRHLPALWLTLFAMLTGDLLRAEDTFETLTLGGTVYTNATVLNTNAALVFIKHAGGLTSLKVKDLGVEDLKKLGYVPSAPPKPNALAAKMGEWTEKMRPTNTNDFSRDLRERCEEMLKASGISLGTAAVVLLVAALALHIFYSVCMRKICLKTKAEPGILVWLPFLQFIPLHRAAGISPGLVLLYLVPLVGVFVFIYWCVKICRALGKSAGLVVFIFVPLLNLCFLPYLAFAGSPDDGPASRLKL